MHSFRKEDFIPQDSAWHAAGLRLHLTYFLVNDIQREHALQERAHKSKYYG